MHRLVDNAFERRLDGAQRSGKFAAAADIYGFMTTHR
jgi:hypothetical protein